GGAGDGEGFGVPAGAAALPQGDWGDDRPRRDDGRHRRFLFSFEPRLLETVHRQLSGGPLGVCCPRRACARRALQRQDAVAHHLGGGTRLGANLILGDGYDQRRWTVLTPTALTAP